MRKIFNHIIQRKRHVFSILKTGVHISHSAYLGRSVQFYPGVNKSRLGEIRIEPYARIEDFCVLNAFGGQITIEQNTFIGPHCVLYGHGNIHIGKNCLIAMHTKIIAANHNIAPQKALIRDMPDVRKPIFIEDDVWIGGGATILSGIKIGKGAIIGAGAVVTKDLPPYSISVGNPARVIKYRDE